jgi:translation initiation factor 1A
MQVWVVLGDVILVSLRPYQDEKGDVIVKFTPHEVQELREEHELPASFDVSAHGGAGDEHASDTGFVFEFGKGDSDDSDSDSDEHSSCDSVLDIAAI